MMRTCKRTAPCFTLPYPATLNHQPWRRSEPEAAAVRDVAVAFQPHAWVNVHSGMEGLFMPYDHVAVIPEGPDAAASLAILQVPQLFGKTCCRRVARMRIWLCCRVSSPASA